MSTPSLQQFVFDNVPGRCSLASATIEHALRVRGHDVDRYNKTIVMVRLGPELIGFENLSGTDSSLVARSVRTYQDALHALLTRGGVPTPRSSTFASDQQRLGLVFATEEIGWPVTIRPARMAYGKGVTAGVAGAADFSAAWARAVEAYDRPSHRPPHRPTPRRSVLVEQTVAGERLHAFVVGDRVVSVTHLTPAHVVGDGTSSVADLVERKNAERARNPVLCHHPIPGAGDRLDVPAAGVRVELGTSDEIVAGGDLVDATDRTPPATAALAVQAATSMPGMAHGAVDIVVTGTGPVVTRIHGAPPPLACFPSEGIPRDVAGAVVDYYTAAPRWKATRSLRHGSAPDDEHRIEPLFQGV
ncbi:hypothetical protein [Phytoactinopolyspora endophytica]|uniref:hypothetical protein n=1 Tax=Phytoactinopolyspora endophytica TaxID=1642495 RepID=UPI00101CB546|nr:hypothetical protein [Phytoactinopolyspora endophytica]